MLDALDIAHSEIKKLVGAMEELAEKAGKEKIQVEAPVTDEALLGQIKDQFGSKLDEATQVADKLARQDAIDAVKDEVLAALAPRTASTRTPTPLARARSRATSA